ncbi:hypothetical protein VBD025_14940 [Virgibacillus flavescens]|uniref:hypothetical protein n=1 Tax=Virgibacillus flavescens TaxID=1611422 RepID=UPI003D3256DE
MIRRTKSLLSVLAGVVVGVMIVSLFKGEEIDWDTIWGTITIILLILFFKLGLSLYKREDIE